MDHNSNDDQLTIHIVNMTDQAYEYKPLDIVEILGVDFLIEKIEHDCDSATFVLREI